MYTILENGNKWQQVLLDELFMFINIIYDHKSNIYIIYNYMVWLLFGYSLPDRGKIVFDITVP